jgi:hypothetical protein
MKKVGGCSSYTLNSPTLSTITFTSNSASNLWVLNLPPRFTFSTSTAEFYHGCQQQHPKARRTSPVSLMVFDFPTQCADNSCSTLVGVVHIRVIENPVKKDFYISDDLLQRKAPFLAEIIHRQGDLGICFEVADFDIETFSNFMAWLNTGRENHLHWDPLGGHYCTSYMPLAKLYIFACYYQIPQLDEDALCRFVSLIHSTGGKERIPSTFVADVVILPTIEEINYIYENTASDSPLRPIVVEAFCVADEEFNYSLMKCNTEFLVDVIMHMRNN